MAASSLLARGHQRVVMDNLWRVFITGGIVPPFAAGGKRFDEFVSGGSPNPSLQALAVALLDAQIDGGFLLTFEWMPRKQNVRADYLSHVSAMRHHGYCLRAELFHALDERWGPHSIDRFASADNCQRPRTRAVSASTSSPRRRYGRKRSPCPGKGRINGYSPPLIG